MNNQELQAELEQAKVDRNHAALKVRRELIPKIGELQTFKAAVEKERNHWKARAEALEKALAHVEHCRDCSENDWVDCDTGGREAYNLLHSEC